MNKVELSDLKPGDFIRVEWNDAPPNVVMVLEAPEIVEGDVSLCCLYPNGNRDCHIVHTQVIERLGGISWPE